MRFPQPLARGRLIARYKRFFADVDLGAGGVVTAHVPNSGRMLGLVDPGNVCWLSRSDSRTRKLPWTLEIVETPDGALVGVNTLRANALTAEAVAGGRIPELAGYAGVRREVRSGAHRLDLRLDHPGRPACWVEVKSVTLSRSPGLAEWPDCVSSRSTRQLAELQQVVAAGDRAVLLFVAQRSDCRRFKTAEDLDLVFAKGLGAARLNGVEVLAYDASVEPAGIDLRQALQIDDHVAQSEP